MSHVPRAIVPDSTDIPQDVVQLRSLIGDLPPEVQNRLAPALLRVVDSTQRRRRILALVQDALGQLRLDMKYLMFDLEATRRERDELRSQLDSE